MKCLVVVAHPDDEALGAGATIYQLTRDGAEVSVCMLSGDVQARNRRPSDEELSGDIDQSVSLLGIAPCDQGQLSEY